MQLREGVRPARRGAQMVRLRRRRQGRHAGSVMHEGSIRIADGKLYAVDGEVRLVSELGPLVPSVHGRDRSTLLSAVLSAMGAAAASLAAVVPAGWVRVAIAVVAGGSVA